MSNNYHTGYLPYSKQEKIEYFAKLWLSRMLFIAISIALVTFFFKIFFSIPSLDYEINNNQPLSLTTKIDETASTQKVNTKETDDITTNNLGLITLKEKILKEQKLANTLKNDLKIVSIGASKESALEPERHNAINVVGNRINDSANETQKNLTNNSSSGRAIFPIQKISTIIETTPKAAPSKSLPENTVVGSSKSKTLDDTKDTQALYKRDIERLFNEPDLEIFLKKSFSKSYD